MSKTPKDIIPGCYKAEAMGFKTFTSNKGKTICCAELVLQDYSRASDYIPDELTVFFNLSKKDGSVNIYAEKDIQAFGLAVGSKEIAEINIGSMFIERKVRLLGAPVYVSVRKKNLGNFSIEEVLVLPQGAYPPLQDVMGDDVPFDAPAPVAEANAKSVADMFNTSEETCAFTGETIVKKVKVTEPIGKRSEPLEDVDF